MRLFLFIALLSLSLSSLATSYRWKDAEGNTVYSQIPPPDNRSVNIVRPPPPPAEKPQVVQKRLQDQLQRFEDANEDRHLLQKKQRENAQAKTNKDKNCTQAQKSLSNFQQKSRVLVKQKDGSYKRYTSQERSEKIKQLNVIIQQECP